ncbi:unnamed protein product, partial [Ectocarpus sp. 12 AP-2014]
RRLAICTSGYWIITQVAGDGYPVLGVRLGLAPSLSLCSTTCERMLNCRRPRLVATSGCALRRAHKGIFCVSRSARRVSEHWSGRKASDIHTSRFEAYNALVVFVCSVFVSSV